MSRAFISYFLAVILLLGAPGILLAAPDSPPAQKADKDEWAPLTGEEHFPPRESVLMNALGQQYSYTSKLRRFEIVFFISIPVTLLLSFTLMEALARSSPTTYGTNRNQEMQSPHYIYMFSTSLLASLYVAIADVHKYNPPEPAKATDVSETKFELPIIGVRF
ncbi:MAG: hypothetical protein LBC99_07335 [Spirochaetota bacterium]|jgi:hypothetical protein|nr:hypothetical protein [Spirochaetota bacterium]